MDFKESERAKEMGGDAAARHTPDYHYADESILLYRSLRSTRSEFDNSMRTDVVAFIY